MPIINRIGEFHADMTEWRRDLHAHPELSMHEARTSATVQAKLTITASTLPAETTTVLLESRGKA